MTRDPFVAFASPGRMHLSLRTLAANDNVPTSAMSPPRHADGAVSTRWPLINRLDVRASTASGGANDHDAVRRRARARQ